LQSFELTRLNHAANLRQEIAALIDQWIQEMSEAMLARWMLDHHKSLQPSPVSSSEALRTLTDPSIAFFPETHPLASEIDSAPPRFSASRPAMKGSVTRKPQKQRQTAVG